MATYADLQNTKTRIFRELASEQAELDAAKARFAAIVDNLTAFQATYSGWAAEVNAWATANPNDPGVQALKADRDRIVSEFGSTKTRANALNTAAQGVA